MNIYDRIVNILLEARIEDYLDRLDEKSNDAQLSYVGVMPIKKRRPGSHEHGLANLMRGTAAKHLAGYRKKNPIGSPDRMEKRANRYNRPYGRPAED
jgi:hypothetical protein